MSITILQNIATSIAAFAHTVVRATSNRFEVTKTVKSVVQATEDTGKIKIQVATGGFFASGDTVTVSDATSARAAINGRHDVITASGVYLTTGTDWPATMATGSWGSCERSNDNFSLRLDVYEDALPVGSVYRYPGKVGATVQHVFEVNRVVQNFSREFATGATAQAHEVKRYTFQLVEAYQNAAYSATHGATASLNSGAAVQVFKSADITDKLIATGETNEFTNAFDELVIRKDTKIPVSFFCAATGATYSLTNGAVTKTIKDTTGSVVRWITPLTGNITLKKGGSTLAEIKNIRVDDKCYHNAMSLYFLNRYGGFDVYDFLSVEEEQEADKTKYHRRDTQAADREVASVTQTTWKRLLLTGRPGARRQLEYVRDLVNSPEVYDENGTPVYVVSKVINIYGDEVVPEIVIEYTDDRCISY